MSGGPRVPHRVDRSVLCPGTVRSLRVVVLASEQAEPGDLAVGDVVLVAFGSNQPPGHEQVGTRPAIVVSVPPPPLRYAVLIVVPITSQAGMWAESNPRVYTRLPAEAGVREGAVALCDQVRACDARRILRFPDVLSQEALAWSRKVGAHLMSSLAWAEVHAVANRLTRDGVLTPDERKAIGDAVRNGPWRLIDTDPTWDETELLAARWPVRGADLWHLAAATALRVTIPELVLLTFDHRLGEAAAGEGLRPSSPPER